MENFIYPLNIISNGILSNNPLNIVSNGFIYSIEIIKSPIETVTKNSGGIGGIYTKSTKSKRKKKEEEVKQIIKVTLDYKGKKYIKQKTVNNNIDINIEDVKVIIKESNNKPVIKIFFQN
jgi:hypothetical protein